ncbi:MAG: DegT/DnrJ/EryC1/StrS family aminotransferase [Candidatus Fermentibacter sp.]|nr:DegT/DnrJ/EryC1/StrS family aminotransferase [Candidatus Fermentibacter sp.]
MPVPLLDISRQHAPILSELRAVLDEALAGSRFIKGPALERFEHDLAGYCDARRAVGCASGTDAIILALQALDLAPGEEVVTTPFTFFASAGAIVRAGGIPVFIDIQPDTFNISPAAFKRFLDQNCALTDRGAVDRRTGLAVRALVAVDLFGQVADMDSLERTCSDWGISLVEDACQSIGAMWKERRAGTFGRIGCFSFFPSKNLGALGDAGAMVTDDCALADRLVSLREHGGQGYIHREVGTNSRMDAIQAGFLTVKLRHLDGWHDGRRRNAEFYARAFADVDEIATPVIDPRAWSVYNQYTVRAADRDGLMAHLKSAGIGCAVYYPLPLHLQECFSSLGYSAGDFPASEKAAAEVLSLPVFGELTEEELGEVVRSVKDFYAKGRGR